MKCRKNDEQHDDSDKENSWIVARVYALDNSGLYCNFAALHKADQRYCKANNPSWPPVEDIRMADDPDFGRHVAWIR